MSEVDKLVNAMAEELNSPNEYSLSTNPDSNPSYILINPDRSLTVPDNLKKIGIQHDHNVESVMFKCPRYNDGIDLSEMSVISINWTNSKNMPGKSYCTDVTYDDNYLTFIWKITQDVTAERGFLTILVCMVETNDEGSEDLHWNSEINKELYIGDGLYVSSDDIVNKYNPAIIDQVLSRVREAEYTIDSYRIESKELEDGSGYEVTITDSRGTETFKVLHGSAVEKGATFTPHVTEDGELSWTNDGGLSNPPTVTIKGAKGDRGETVYVPSVSEEGVLSWTNDGGLENPEEVNIKGPQGDIGPVGPKGDTGVGEQGPMGAAYEAMLVTDGIAEVDPFQKYRIDIPMNRKLFTESAIDLLGAHDGYWHITHAVTVGGDIYYIIQDNDVPASAWPRLMKYDHLTNSIDVVLHIDGYVIDPVESTMVADGANIYILNYLISNDFGVSAEYKHGHMLVYTIGSNATNFAPPRLTSYNNFKDPKMADEVISPGVIAYGGNIYIFGGLISLDVDGYPTYSNKIYVYNTTRCNFDYESYDLDPGEFNHFSITESIYGSTTVLIGDKIYAFNPHTGLCTIYDINNKEYDVNYGAVTDRIGTNIRELAEVHIGHMGSRSNITATVVVDDLIYLLVSNPDSGKDAIVTFDTKTYDCSVVYAGDIHGSIPSGAYGDYDYGPLPAIYLNNKPYIIRRDQKPLIFEDPGDMKDEYLYLISDEFAEPIRLDIDLYDRNRDVVEFEIHRLEFNDLGTALHMHYTHNGVASMKTYPITWIDKNATKDVSLIRLHIEHANTVLRYNTNTEYGSLNRIEADIEQLKADVEALGVATDKLTYRVVDTLPETGEIYVVYLIPNTTSQEQNIKDEYMWIEDKWELIGNTAISSDSSDCVKDVQDTNGTSFVKNGVAKIPLETKLDKINKGSKIVVYTNDSNSDDATTHYLGNDKDTYKPYAIPMIFGDKGGKTAFSGYLVTADPVNKYHCANKQYVDDNTTKLYKYILENVGLEQNQTLILVSPNDNLSIRRVYFSNGETLLCINTMSVYNTQMIPHIISATLSPFEGDVNKYVTSSNAVPIITDGRILDFDTMEESDEFCGIRGFFTYEDFATEIYPEFSGHLTASSLNTLLPYYLEEYAWYNEEGTEIVDVKPLYRIDL